MTILEIIFVTLMAYLGLSGLYQTVLAIASYTHKKKEQQKTAKTNKLLVLVPAYKCDEVILHTVKKNLRLKYLYPQTAFDLQVIADQLQPETLLRLKEMGASVHKVSFEKSTKVKSLQSAIQANEKQYDGVIVLDADNVAEFNMLFQANKYLNYGYEVIQGNRKAANSNSTFALLDGLSEKANTKMLCEGANQLGLSSKLSGSAMVFNYNTFAEAIMQMTAIGGFDKELELYFTSQKTFIKYADEIVVFDEKITSSEAFATQRGRWLQAQYNFLKASILPASKSLFNGNVDYFHKALQLALPPRALSPFVLTLGFAVSAILGYQTGIFLSLVGLALTMGSYLLVLKPSDFIHDLVKLAGAMPALAKSVIKSLSIMNKAKKEFLHTEHKVVTS